jgi:hypothetical protein
VMRIGLSYFWYNNYSDNLISDEIVYLSSEDTSLTGSPLSWVMWVRDILTPLSLSHLGALASVTTDNFFLRISGSHSCGQPTAWRYIPQDITFQIFICFHPNTIRYTLLRSLACIVLLADDANLKSIPQPRGPPSFDLSRIGEYTRD